MLITDKTRKYLRLHSVIFYCLLIIIFGLLGWLSLRYKTQFDWSANNRSSLTTASIETVKQLDSPVTITAYVGEDPATRQAVRKLVDRYRLHNNRLSLNFINPDTNPAKLRELGISSNGELLIDYQGKTERLQQLTEQTFTNALQRLLRDETHWLVFITGHGERNPYGQANHDYSEFSKRLSDQGFQIQTHNLLDTPIIPDNTDILVIANPTTSYLPGEIAALRKYIHDGGNFLWLTEPGGLQNLTAIADDLGVTLLTGTIVDATTQMFGMGQPDFAIVMNYPYTDITPDFSQFTLFPQAAALQLSTDNALNLLPQVFLQTLERSWTETGPITGTIQFDENSDETAGPLTLGISWQRRLDNDGMQRLIMIGDSDFVSNTYLGNGGNLELGLNIINWLAQDDHQINIQPVSAPDIQLQLSNMQILIIASLFFFILPLGFIGLGVIIWLRRRKK